MKKIKEILSSIRFQQMLVIAVLQSLVVFNVISGDQSIQLINIISTLFGASVVLGTVDKHADTKTTTVSIPDNVSSVTATTNNKD